MEELLTIPEKANSSMARVLNSVAQSTAMRAKARIRSGQRSGHIYNFGGSLHQASAPGEPPANLSGTLASSITFTKMTSREGSFATAGAQVAYAATLEFGGFAEFRGNAVFIEPRPFLLPSFEEAIVGIESKLKREFERSVGR